MRFIALLLTVLVSLSFTNSNAQNYRIDVEKSAVNWTGFKLGGSHNGDLKLSSGVLKTGDDGISGKFIIDMTSINCLDLEGEQKTDLEGHLSAADFFDVENHEKAKFKLNKVSIVRPVEGSDITHKVTGELTIKGKTNPVQFPASIAIEGEMLTANAKLSIDRTLWDMAYGSAGSVVAFLGDKMIYDDIELELNISAMVDNTLMEDVKEVAEKVGEGTKNAAQKVGEGTKNAAEKVGEETKKVIEKVGDAIKGDKEKKDND